LSKAAQTFLISPEVIIIWLNSSFKSCIVIFLKILALRMFTSRGSPEEQHPYCLVVVIFLKVLDLKMLTSKGSPEEQHPCWFFF
jgi:hypothetical protein